MENRSRIEQYKDRLKEDVEKTLSAKEETIVWLDLSAMQKKFYRAILDRNFNVLNQAICDTRCCVVVMHRVTCAPTGE